MANAPLLDFLQHLRSLAGTEEEAGQSDGELLQRFAAARDEAAFATLLRRHGPLVWGLCRQVLGEVHAAEDVFQATFLVLARRAGSIRRQESLPAWLYRVAFNLATTAKTGAARRRSHERLAVPMAAADPLDEVVLRDWQPILHEEVNRLPEKYRVPVVLCYLRGKSHSEASRELGRPVGTVKACLARARNLLRTRLARRGLTLPAGGLATLLAATSESKAVPATLFQVTLQAALWFVAGRATGTSVASAQALLLAKGALKTMAVSRLTLWIGFFLLAGVVGSGMFALRTYGDGGPGGPPADAAGQEPPALAAGVPFRPERPDPDPREVAMPIDQAVLHRIDKEIVDPSPVPEGAVVIGNPPFFVKPPGEQVRALVGVLIKARTQALEGKVEVKAGLNLNVLATGPILQAPDQVAVRSLVRLGGLLELEIAYARSQTKIKSVSWRPLVQVPVDLPPGSYKLLVTWREVASVPAGKLIKLAAALPLVETFDFEVVERLAFSKPVRSGAVEFQAVVDVRCPVPAAGGSSLIDVGLRLTNRDDKELVFDLFDTITMDLKSADGKLFQRDGGRNGTLPCPPLRLGAGRSATVFRSGRLEWQKDGKPLVLTGPDGAGGIWLFRGLGPGKYLLSIRYENTAARERMAPEATKGRTVWKGQVQTESVEFAIVPPKVEPTGKAAAIERDGMTFELVLPDRSWSIPENKPGLKTPIELGLRITNRSEKALTFGRYGGSDEMLIAEMTGADGKALQRNLLEVFRHSGPQESDFALVLPGKSVTFFLDAGLFWERGTHRLGGKDGHGGGWFFDDLKPGRYQVRIVYESKDASVTLKPSGKVMKDIWTGKVETPFVEVSLGNGGREHEKDKGAAAVERDGAAFELVLPDRAWSIPEDKPGLKTPTKLGLRVTNKTDKPLRFARFATPFPEIAGSDGMPLKPTTGVWKRTPLITEADFPLVLPGKSVTFSIDAALFWQDSNLQWGGSYAHAGDATGWGSSWSFQDLKPGRYKIRIVYQSKEASATVDPDRKVLTDIWTGRIETPFVEVSLRERAKEDKR
jgi:RNA polymerase sigma-70 factor (ECF subfamily)